MSTKLFHLHIPRTGGTSLFRSVTNELGKRRVIALPKKGIFRPGMKLDFGKRKLESAIFLTGHYFFSNQLPLDCGWVGITVVRDPVERLISAYRQIKDTIAIKRSKKFPIRRQLLQVSKLSFEEFSTGRRGSFGLFDVPEYSFNLQTWMLAGGNNSKSSTLLDRAKSNIDKYFKIVLSFDNLPMLTHLVASAYNNVFELNLIHTKGSRYRVPEISEALRSRINKLHQLDVKLYNWIKGRTTM